MRICFSLALAAVMLLVAACKKEYHSPGYGHNSSLRKVRFELYTKEDFSGDKHNITFSLHMHNHERKILDSALATMKVEEIPDSLHKIVIEKFVPGNDTATLVVGFDYYLENIGYSWYLEEFPAKDTFKLLQYSFR